jgi:threonyl-tRNA synthetase
MRIHDQSVLHRNEASGTLAGLTRVRQLCQDDAHLFVRPDQIEEEVTKLLALVAKVYGFFGLGYDMDLSTRNPASYLGELETWERAEANLRAALEANGIPYRVQPEEAAFYGPKIDIHVTDAIGRRWQCATIQLDYQLPERFDLEYVAEDQQRHRPVVIHRAIYGSFERFIAILTEHYAGAFPAWLSPVQARILTVSDRFDAWAKEVAARLTAEGFRVELDESSDKLGAKIRNAELAKVPFALVVGEKEVEARGVAPRRHGGGDLKTMPLDAFVALMKEEATPPY